MTFKYLNIKLSVFALGLVVVLATSSLLGANEQARAATASVDCGKTMSGQVQSCEDGVAGATVVKAASTAWLLPPQQSKVATDGVKSVSVNGEEESEISTAGLPREAFILFVVALAGIAYLGRRRKTRFRGN